MILTNIHREKIIQAMKVQEKKQRFLQGEEFIHTQGQRLQFRVNQVDTKHIAQIDGDVGDFLLIVDMNDDVVICMRSIAGFTFRIPILFKDMTFQI